MDEFIEIPLRVEELDVDVGLKAEHTSEVVTDDYNVLRNKPSINGTEHVGNYNEIDPTVPNWAKGEEPEEMNITDIYDLWNRVFN